MARLITYYYYCTWNLFTAFYNMVQLGFDKLLLISFITYKGTVFSIYCRLDKYLYSQAESGPQSSCVGCYGFVTNLGLVCQKGTSQSVLNWILVTLLHADRSNQCRTNAEDHQELSYICSLTFVSLRAVAWKFQEVGCSSLRFRKSTIMGLSNCNIRALWYALLGLLNQGNIQNTSK